MKPKRDFHTEVRVVYRACRRLYGVEKTQDECLEIFKAVFPEQLRLSQSDEAVAFVPDDVRNHLYRITRKWNPQKHLAEVIRKAEAWFAMPFETSREELIQFYKDITPVAMRIRKLTPRECFRLMGVAEKDIDVIQASGISKSAQYKLAGNSIVAGTGHKDSNGNYDGVLFHLFRKMFVDTGYDKTDKPIQLTLF